MQGLSKGSPQSKGLLENAEMPKRWMVKGMVPERPLEERLRMVKFFRFPREGGIGPESEFCDKSRTCNLDKFPRVGGMLPLS